MAPLPILVALGVAVLGILSHQVITNTVREQTTPPPLDLGCGSDKGSMFDFIAGRYDAINRILAFRMDVGWRKRMVQRIQNHLQEVENPQIVDVATGTADVALMTSQMIPSAQIVGMDPSHGMLNVGRKKIQQQNRNDQINLQWADARDLSALQPNTFDAGTMAFGIRNVPERETALCEIYQILKPNSLFTILEFSEPPKDGSATLLQKTAGIFIQHVVPFVGGILSGQPRMYKHLQNSIQNFPSPLEFEAQINALQCGGNSAFHVDEVEHLNLGSVQLYALRSLKSEVVEATTSEENEGEVPEEEEAETVAA